MADTPVRAHVKPAAGTRTLLYVASGNTVVSTVRACNLGSQKDYIRIAKELSGETEDDKQYLVYEYPLQPGIPYAQTEGETLLEDDSIYVYSRNGTTAFSLSGVEVA